MNKTLAAVLLMTASAVHAQSYPISVAYDTVYDTVAGTQLKMDVYEPIGTTGPRPLVMVIHGGCFIHGDKSEMTYLAQNLAAHGMVVANVNYRLAGVAPYPAAHRDVGVALRYMRQNALRHNIDQTRVASIGSSAGSTLAAVLGVEPALRRDGVVDALSSRVNVVINNFGITDFMHDQYAPDLSRTDCAEHYMGKKRESSPQAFFDASPLNKVDAQSAKFIIVHGLNDISVPPVHAQRMHQRILEKGGKSTLILQEGVAHTAPWSTYTLTRAMLKREFGMPHQIVEDTASAVRIDAGSLASQTATPGFASDQFFTGGSAFLYDPMAFPSSIPTAQTVRHSSTAFSYLVPNNTIGFKKVSMTFFEPYDVPVGYRMQDVRMQGVNAFSNLDVVRIAGKGRTAMKQEVYFATKSDTLRLDFVKKSIGTGSAAAGAIEVMPLISY